MFGFPWHLEPQYDLSKLDPVARLIQIRDDDNLAPKDLAKEDAVQMKQAEFPAIASDTLLYIVDGNTQTAACAINGVKFFPAIVIEFPYIGVALTAYGKPALSGQLRLHLGWIINHSVELENLSRRTLQI
jgi:hypothetical protein